MRPVQKLAWLAVLIAALGLGACKDINETFKNNHNTTMTSLTITIRINGAGNSLPPVSSWYNNHVPQSVTPLGSGLFRIKWRVIVPPGQTVHVGCTFQSSQDVDLVGSRFGDPGPTRFRLRGATMGYSYQPGAPTLQVHFTNENEDGEPATVTQAQWATHTEYIALANLDWEDPVLDILDWQPITEETLVLYPGEIQTFEVPVSAFDGASHALVRWQGTDENGEVDQLPVFEIPVAALLGDADVKPVDGIEYTVNEN